MFFARCVSKHFSTKYYPFKLLHNQEPVLPIDVKYKLSSITENLDPDEPFDKDVFDTVLASSNVIREEIHRQAGENIKKVQKKQQRDYESRNKSSASNDIYIGADALRYCWETINIKIEKVGNLLWSDRMLFHISPKRFGRTKEQEWQGTEKKYNKAQLKLFLRDLDGINEH